MENKRDLESRTVKVFENENDWKVENAAMLLALTWTLNLEDKIKSIVRKNGFKYVVTEMGGSSHSDFQSKTVRSILGACLDAKVIQKNTKEIHALLHAAEEAKRGILVNSSSSTSIAVKIAIVRDENWISVAIFGQSAFHPITNHQRAGLGVMHI